jgi:hypothetical protein
LWAGKYGICDSVNHTGLPEEVHLPEQAGRDKQGKKGDGVEYSKQNQQEHSCYILTQTGIRRM